MKLITYTNTHIKGYQGKAITVNEAFAPDLDKINAICAQMNFECIVTSSFRSSTVVPGAIVPPAKMSNHLVGHAIDCNLKCIRTGEFFNSAKMGDGKGDDENVIRAIEKAGLCWGGEFNIKDEVHFDDRLNIKNPAMWHQLYLSLNGH